MSWLQNLSKIKDEVTNFATEVLAPDVPDEGPQSSDSAQVKQKEAAEQQLQEMASLVATQDAEVGFFLIFWERVKLFHTIVKTEAIET